MQRMSKELLEWTRHLRRAAILKLRRTLSIIPEYGSRIILGSHSVATGGDSLKHDSPRCMGQI